MRLLLYFLFLLGINSKKEAAVAMNVTAETKYVDSTVEKTILGQRYQFIHRKEAEDLVSLRIVHLPDSAVCFDDFLRLYGGDCNAHSDLVGKYELRRDSFFFYSFNTYTETWDVRYPSSSDSGRTETWVFRRNGTMVRVSIQEAKEGDALLETIRKKLEKEIAAR